MSGNILQFRYRCERCDGDGYVDVMDDWGGVLGPAPCPECSDEDPYEAIDRLLSADGAPPPAPPES